MHRLVRPTLAGLSPYVPGEQPSGPDVLKLNANENPYPPSPRVADALRALDGDLLRKYPDPLWRDVRRAAAAAFAVAPEQVAVGNGSDEILRLVLTAFVEPGEAVAFADITYSLYATLVEIHGARPCVVPLGPDLQYTDAMAEAPAKVLFVCHPNAPTGLPAPAALLDRILDRFSGLVVVDEAYVEFADHDYLELARRRDDVLVVRTLSKSHSLAGMRIGFAVGHPSLISTLEAVKDSYNVSLADQAVASAALDDRATMRSNCDRVIATRERLIAELRALGLDVPPSRANFVLARFPSPSAARTAFEALRERGVYLRYFSRPRLDDRVRISIGTDVEIDRVLGELRRHLGRG